MFTLQLLPRALLTRPPLIPSLSSQCTALFSSASAPAAESTSETALSTSDSSSNSPKTPSLPPAVQSAFWDAQLPSDLESAAALNAAGEEEESDEPKYPESGRAWTASELRVKSWDELHALHYVLLKERSMLATEKERYNRSGRRMPGWGRMKKVKASQARLQTVINERRRAHKAVLAAVKEAQSSTQ